LVVAYLLSSSIAAVYFALPSHNRSSSLLNYLSILQIYLFFTFIFALLIKANDFGSVPECNGNAMIVIFRPFPMLRAGQIVLSISSGIIFLFYTGLTLKDHIPPQLKQRFKVVQIADAVPLKTRQRPLPQERPEVEVPGELPIYNPTNNHRQVCIKEYNLV
jgi:hypothetical protein